MFSAPRRTLSVTSATASIEDFGPHGAVAPPRPSHKRIEPSLAGPPVQRQWGPGAAQLRRRRALMLAVLALHLGLGWLLLKTHFRAQIALPPAPITVALLAAKAEPLPELPRPKLPPLPAPPPVMHFAIPTFNTNLSPTPTATAVYAPVQQEQVRAPEAAAPAAVQAMAAPPAAVKQVAPSAVRYLVEPRLTVPLQSRRLGESGIVHLRILVDTRGHLKDAALKKSSGFDRIDSQALKDIRSARFVPYLENGQPLEWETTALLSYELER